MLFYNMPYALLHGLFGNGPASADLQVPKHSSVKEAHPNGVLPRCIADRANRGACLTGFEQQSKQKC